MDKGKDLATKKKYERLKFDMAIATEKLLGHLEYIASRKSSSKKEMVDQFYTVYGMIISCRLNEIDCSTFERLSALVAPKSARDTHDLYLDFFMKNSVHGDFNPTE